MSQVSMFEGQLPLDQPKPENKTISRKEYNRMYYQKTKALRSKKSKTPTNVFQLFTSKPRLQNGGLSGALTAFKLLELVVLVCLSSLMTYFLITEAAAFYLDANESTTVAYLKAGMVETVAILFSISRGQSAGLKWAQRTVVVLLCALTLWTLSGRPVQNATQDVSKARELAQTIEGLEQERTQKEALQNQLVHKEWLGAARKYEKGLDEVRMKLDAARKEYTSIQKPHAILNSLGILLAFRLLVVVANLICFHRLAEKFSNELTANEANFDCQTELKMLN